MSLVELFCLLITLFSEAFNSDEPGYTELTEYFITLVGESFHILVLVSVVLVPLNILLKHNHILKTVVLEGPYTCLVYFGKYSPQRNIIVEEFVIYTGNY